MGQLQSGCNYQLKEWLCVDMDYGLSGMATEVKILRRWLE